MTEIQFILDGVQCNPKNWKDINYVLDFSARRFRELQLSVDTLEFVAEDHDRVTTWRNTFGDYVGMPLDIVYPNGLTVPYYLDFSDSSTVFRDRSTSVKIIRYKQVDKLSEHGHLVGSL